MKRYFCFLIWFLLLPEFTFALPTLDRTCQNCSRRYLDSLNAYNRRPIRLNQSGFRPQDYKYAYVADPAVQTFKVIDASSGAEAWSGSLNLIGNAIKPNIWINGSFNSIASVYEFGSQDSISSNTEVLYRADFTGLKPPVPGEYFIVVGSDTSATFHIHPSIYNAILENSLQFFGVQRCGNTKSHFHAPCHLKDGSAIGHDLSGGWHDCGDHFKVSETLGYTDYVLSMVYLVYQDKAEDRYGNSYADTTFTDGIPDILYEAKIGADFIFKLYKASKADGLIDKQDMYHSVGVADADHQYWDLPERQDMQPETKGGPDRVVLTGIGSNTAGIFAASLANVATGYKVYDAVYADSLLEAAKDIYANVVKKIYPKTTTFPGFYTGGGALNDDAAAAAFSLWYATKDTTYAYDLYKNPAINDNSTNYLYNLDYFKGGYMGNISGFTPGGWATDYQNVHAYVLFAMQRLILSNEVTAQSYGITPLERDTLSSRVMATFRKLIDNATNDGDSTVLENPATSGEPHEGSTKLHVISPYNLVWTSFDWGVIRYNLGTANAIFLMYELTNDERYLRVALDNMYYALGANPWDISFLLGAGDKNPQHPHNRAANPDGYNAGGMPYEYKCPKGALMGGRAPTLTLIEDWSKYTSTETCVDFSAQFLFPAQSLAESLPIDADGPLFSNIAATPISDTSAVVSWDANEIALVTVFYNQTPDNANVLNVAQNTATKGGSVILNGLIPGQTYYFYLEGMDTKRNITTDNNHGQWYKFTMTSAATIITDVTICQVDHRSAKIYWWTTDRSNSLVNYGSTSGSYTSTQAGTEGAVLFHEVELTNLTAGTTYYFTVSSGISSSTEYSFTTEAYASYANLDIFLKPTSYQQIPACSDWHNCNTFILSIANNDTVVFENFEIRLYLGKNSNLGAVSNIKHSWNGSGFVASQPDIIFETAQPDGVGGYYLPITVNGTLDVSGQILFQIQFTSATYNDFADSWTIRPHLDASDPVQFNGIDITNGPYFTGSETEYVEKNASGTKIEAFTKTPYAAVYYHGKHIYGYSPDYTPENGPQVYRTVNINFTKPFVSPNFSIEKTDYKTLYEGTSSVTPTGFIDYVEQNNQAVFFLYEPTTRMDSVVFALDTTLSYGNNYIEWVSWHNHKANEKGSYDCACAVVRSNVEIDTITTPLEKRYIVFDVDTVRAYTNKMAEVNVRLLDSNLMLLDTVSLTLSLQTLDNSAEFWTTPTSTISVTNIMIVNGKATFYVSSQTATVTTLYAKSATTSTSFEYQAAQAVLIIDELPPWPIIDNAKIVDSDCDNIGDIIKITLSNEYQADQSFNKLIFTYNQDTLESTVASVNAKELSVSIQVLDTNINTNPTGSLTLISSISGELKEHSDFYTDGISPTLLSISVLERLPNATSDQVFLQFSEPISAPGTNWPIQLFTSAGTPITATPTVNSSEIYNDSLNIWAFNIAIPSDGISLVQEGMLGQLLSSASITDKALNGISSCTQPKLPISLKIIPVPLTYASISDADEDGLAEHVRVVFERAVDAKHQPDEISVIFGSATPETLWTKSYTFITDSIAILNLTKPFALGNTNGSFGGSNQGRTLIGAGQVIQHKGNGANYENSSVLAEDLTGPVFLSATVKENILYSLSVVASEPLLVKDSTLDLLQRERSGPIGLKAIDVASWNVTQNSTNLNLVYSEDISVLIKEGDRIRLSPLSGSLFSDKSGNLPATNNPWVNVMGDGNPNIKFSIQIRDDISTFKKEGTPSSDNSPSKTCLVNPMTQKLNCIKDGIMTEVIDTLTTPLQGVVWKIELDVPRGSGYSEAPAWDSLNLEYDVPIYTNLGHFVQRFNEKLSIPSSTYLSSTNTITLFIEWAPRNNVGITSVDGRAVATGAYIAKVDLKTKFIPNKNQDIEVMTRFSGKSSHEKTMRFGIRREK